MSQNIGPHLLGRKASPPDARDYKLSEFMVSDDELVAKAMDELKKTTVGYSYYLKKKVDPPKSSHWFKAMAFLGQIGNQPTPNPTPTDQDFVWNLTRQLDQGETGHCVGFGWSNWHNSEPVQGTYTNDDAHTLYYDIKVLEGEPRNEDGAYPRDGAKVMQKRGRLSAYAQADSLDEINAYLRSKGPMVVGTDWTDDMFEPDSKGYVRPTGAYAGGHCWLIVGDLVSEGAYLADNSWGSSWGLNGRFKIKYADFEDLLNSYGEAYGALELAA